MAPANGLVHSFQEPTDNSYKRADADAQRGPEYLTPTMCAFPAGSATVMQDSHSWQNPIVMDGSVQIGIEARGPAPLASAART